MVNYEYNYCTGPQSDKVNTEYFTSCDGTRDPDGGFCPDCGRVRKGY